MMIFVNFTIFSTKFGHILNKLPCAKKAARVFGSGNHCPGDREHVCVRSYIAPRSEKCLHTICKGSQMTLNQRRWDAKASCEMPPRSIVWSMYQLCFQHVSHGTSCETADSSKTAAPHWAEVFVLRTGARGKLGPINIATTRLGSQQACRRKRRRARASRRMAWMGGSPRHKRARRRVNRPRRRPRVARF